MRVIDDQNEPFYASQSRYSRDDYAKIGKMVFTGLQCLIEAWVDVQNCKEREEENHSSADAEYRAKLSSIGINLGGSFGGNDITILGDDDD